MPYIADTLAAEMWRAWHCDTEGNIVPGRSVRALATSLYLTGGRQLGWSQARCNMLARSIWKSRTRHLEPRGFTHYRWVSLGMAKTLCILLDWNQND